jgi:hypothetical protein
MANSADLVKCTAKEFWTAGGTPPCKTVTVRSKATNAAGSKMTIHLKWADGTSPADVVLAPGESHTYVCAITSITAHETVVDASMVEWTVEP